MTFQKNYNFVKKLQSRGDERGISVLLAVLILSSLTIMTIAISDVVLRVGRSSRQIGQSEIAYYAAETAVEKALYYIEKSEPRTIIIPGGGSGSLSDISGANWTRVIAPQNRWLIKCGSGPGELPANKEGICVNDTSDDIGPDNRLKVQLNPGHSFQLDLNFWGLPLANSLQISWNGNGKIIALSTEGQEIDESSPADLENLDTNLYTVRLVNQDSSLITFELKPSAKALPIGILVTGTGTYQNEQRILEVERKSWQIY